MGQISLDASQVPRYSSPVQQLASESIEAADAANCSAQLLEVAPLIMRRIRSEMRRQSPEDLSVPLFRALRFLRDHPGVSLSELAEAMGLTMPSASKLVQRLVVKKVIERRVGEDRRRVHLTLTEQGRVALALARLETARQMEESLESLSPQELATVSAALRILGRTFGQGGVDVNVP